MSPVKCTTYIPSPSSFFKKYAKKSNILLKRFASCISMYYNKPQVKQLNRSEHHV